MRGGEQTGRGAASIIAPSRLRTKSLPMKTRFATLCLAVGPLVAPFAAVAADSDADRQHPVAFVKDSVITTEVKATLAADKMRSLATVHVDTDSNGMVVLSGTTRSQGNADKAVEIARTTEGVSSVRSTIVVKKDD
jgi:hyperosmotically inducible periplasmic protein